jgi:predicted phosphodiesterase
MGTLKDFKAKHDQATVIENLKSELESAKADQLTASAVRDILGTAKLNTDELQLPKWAYEPKTVKCPGIPKLFLSDFHWGERVFRKQVGGNNEYNLTIARARLTNVIDTFIYLCSILYPEMKYPGVVVPLAGDMVSGDIHEELSTTNEATTMLVLMDLYRHLVPAVTLLADTFGKVFIPCVTGNHDRATKKTQAKNRNHTSYSWLLYQFLAEHFAEDDRVTFYIPDGSDALYRVYGIRYNTTHGDQFKGGDGIIGPLGPITRGDQKKLAARQATGQDYDVLEFGHFHQRIITPRLRGNNCLKGYDEYAIFNNFKFEPPSQNMWVTHPDHGITFDAPVYADRKGHVAKAKQWVSI